jgi:hypothetical protein
MSTARLRSPGPRARHRPEDRVGDFTRLPAPDPEPAPPLHAALDYRARRLCAALDDARARDAALAQFPPATAALLRWWCAGAVCRSRAVNFNPAQQRAILHALLAHDLPGGDDPATLHRRSCTPDAAAIPPPQARYRLRLAPGSGLRWVLQALLVWCWAGGGEAHARLRLLAAGPALQQRLRAAILGTADPGDGDDGPEPAADPDRSSLMRHARLFLPPALRAPFRDWLATSAAAALEPTAADGLPGDALPGVFRLLAESADGNRRLQIDLLVATGPEVTAIGDSLLDLPSARAIRLGACKLPVLEAVAPVGADLRARPPARPGRRPRLSRMQQRLLTAALAALRLREPAFVALDQARRPRLRVLCAGPQLLRAARRWLIAAGLDPQREIAIHSGAPVADAVRVVLDDLQHGARPRDALAIADPRVCLVAVLRTHRDDPAMAPAKIAAAGAALLWPEPEFAELRAENGERAARGRPPRHRIDALSIFDDPACHDDYAGLPHARGDGDTAAIVDDLFLAPVREHATGLDLPLPGFGPPASGEAPGDAWLGALPRRVLRRRRALAVERSIHGHADCSAHDSGLRRAFLECAEADPAIECHGLPDPRRHRAPGREALLARCADGRGWPDALVRTAQHLYLVEFLPSQPLRSAAPGPAERALRAWLRATNASAANAHAAHQPDARTWRRVALPAPLFWSWKRRGGALSALLESLEAAE